MWLLYERGTRSTVLAQRACVTKQAMSQLVRLMEKQGYLEQVGDPSDTRAKIVRMTARGEAVRTACVEVRQELNQELAQAIGAKQAKDMEAYLDEMARLSAAAEPS